MSLITPDFGLLFWMTVIFGLLFFLLAKFGFPVITGMVDKRNARISESLHRAQEADLRMARLADEQEELIKRTRLEQSRILKEASEAREEMLAQARDDAAAAADKIIEDARLRIAAEKEAALKDIRRQVALISMEVAEKVVRKDLETDSEQVALIDRLLEESKNADWS